MKITQIRSATIIVDYNNTKFLIDPWLGPKDYMPGFDTAVNSQIRQPRVELPVSIEKIVDVDCVIVTHIHPDHWDEYAEKAIKKNIKIFVQYEFDKKYLTERGFNNIEILSERGSLFNEIRLYKTGTQHGKREIFEPLCKQINTAYEAMGVVFESTNEKTLYIAGDTIYCDEVKEALDRFIPKVIVVNACGATMLNGERIIMNADDIKEILNKAPHSTVIASHMDTVSHLTVTREDLKKYKKENNINNLLIPDDGEIMEI